MIKGRHNEADHLARNLWGTHTDEAQVAAAKPQAAPFPTEVDRLLGGTDHFGGNKASLADLHLLPVLTYLHATSEGQASMAARPNIRAWMGRMKQLSSVQAVMPSA
jgi:glutathione S-transferase